MRSSKVLEHATAEDLLETRGPPHTSAAGAGPQERTAQLVRLENQVNRILVQADNAAGALYEAMGAICESLGWDTARYWSMDDTGTRIHLRRAWSRPGVTTEEAATRMGDPVFEPGEGLIGAVWGSGQPRWVADVVEQSCGWHAEIAELSGCRSALVFPVSSDHPIGVLELGALCIPQPDEALLHGLGVLSTRIGSACQRFHEWEQLRESDECANSTFELAAIGITHVAPDGRLIHVNRQFCEMLGYSKDELIGKSVKDISHPDDMHVTDADRDKLRSGEIDQFTAEKRYLRRDGTAIWVRITVAVRRDADSQCMYDVSVVDDISERKAAEEALRSSEEFYHSTFEVAAIGITHVGAGGRLLHANERFCEMLGYSRDELIGRTVREISHPDDVSAADMDRARLQAGEIDAFKTEKRYLHKDGTPVWVRITAAVKRAPDGAPLYDVSIVENISDRKTAEKRIAYLATHDEMTGLPNRAMFTELLDNAIEAAKRYGSQFSVLFIDLDRFKLINDSLGHDAGDQLLKEMSLRFKECIRASDTVARLGGDEFVVLVREVEDPAQVAVVARKILSAALRPITVSGQECRVTASVGICTCPADAEDGQSLMKNADMAMYLAKGEGKNNFQFYSKSIQSQSIARLTLENALRCALERGEFFVHYQPKMDMKTRQIKGAEALLRWDSPEVGRVAPAQFIPLAEEMGLIIPIGRWVLREACKQNVAWQEQGLPQITMAVNLSPRQFRDPGLLQDVAAVLEETGMAPDLLDLEITESMLMHDVDAAVEKLGALKEMGVLLSIDDFGTGYSSLAQLKRFPVDTLKVDRSFVRELPNDAEDMAITEAIITMGRMLGVVVVAEGVETAEQQSFLQSRHCDQIQGFYFSRPCEPGEFASRFREHLLQPDSRPAEP